MTCDIEILAETWGCGCILNFGEYEIIYSVDSQKHKGISKGRKSGGIKVLIRSSISKNVKIRKSSNNFIWIEVDKRYIGNLEENLLILATYVNDITSTYYDDRIFEELHQDILHFSNENTPILLTGDFNGRTGTLDDIFADENFMELPIPPPNTFPNLPLRRNCDTQSNSHGRKIIQLCQTFDFKILNGRTTGDKIGNITYFKNDLGASAIDYSLCNSNIFDFIDDFLVLPMTELSDHSKIITIFKNNVTRPKEQSDNYEWKSLESKFEWDPMKREKFSSALSAQHSVIEEISQRIEAGIINRSGELIQKLFIDAAKSSLSQKSAPIRKKRQKSKKWFDGECNNLKKQVRQIGRDKHKKPHDTLLKTKYHEKLKEFKSKCKSKRYYFWQNKLNVIGNSLDSPIKFWKNWKYAKETLTEQKTPAISGKDWYKHFLNLHTEGNEKQLPQESNSQTPHTTSHSDIGSLKINEAFSEEEFMSCIKNLKSNKAQGLDMISNEMIKNSPKPILDILYKFINLCLDKSFIPSSWCLDLINPFYKDGTHNDPNNYRGICISSALLKIICTLLDNRIQEFCTKKDIISKNQIGFKRNHRTSDHLLTLKAIVKKYVSIGKKKLFACFVDLKKAFDSVWHKGLFYKVKNIGIYGKSLDLIKDIYKKTKCAIKINNRRTEFFEYTKGVRQGCPLSPSLFNIFLNDLFEILDNNNDSNITLDHNYKVNALMYADDLILLAETEKGLQNQIIKLNIFCDRWNLSINSKKTKVMTFNRGNRLIKTKILSNNTPLDDVKTMKYLGFTISANQCSFTPTIEDLSTKANRAIFALNNTIKLSRLPTKLALKLFYAQISPILLYGSEVWGPYINQNYTDWDTNKVERVHTQYLKRILGCNYHTSNNMTRGEVGSRPLLVDIIKRVVNYTKNIETRPTSTVNKALNFEKNDTGTSNFFTYINKFNLSHNDFTNASKKDITRSCHDNYDRYWLNEIRSNSPKATTYVTFKSSINTEKYLISLKNKKQKNTLSRFRLSNHELLIEKGRHMRPKLERTDRRCFFCQDEVEDELHFITKCPLYSNERETLFQACRVNSIHFDSFSTDYQRFVFILSNENPTVLKNLSRFISSSFEKRKLTINA